MEVYNDILTLSIEDIMGATSAVIRQVVKEQRLTKIPKNFVQREVYSKLQSYSTCSEIVVITESNEEELKVQVNNLPATITILPAWKWTSSFVPSD